MSAGGPLVSVIMPAYNAEKYIGEAIESVISQTYKKLELIVVNDGSTDKTLSIIKQYNDERVLCIDQKNKGVSAARNAGLDFARGQFITFIDSDDVLPSESLKKRIDVIFNNPDIDIVDGSIIIFHNERGKHIEDRVYKPYYNGALLRKLLKLDDKVFFGPFYLIRSEVINAVRFPVDMTHVEDLTFFIDIASKKELQYSHVKDCVYYYRKGHTSAMSDIAGIEKGYIQMLTKLKDISSVSLGDILLLRIKILKMLVLSWLTIRRPERAISSCIKIIFGRY
jgi:glycosyltransferase involved in cell wall biosynthesis